MTGKTRTQEPAPSLGSGAGESGDVDLTRLRALAEYSHAVITKHQDAGGAYPAAPTFSAYKGYAWLRDGSFTAEGISRYGDVASAGRFHDWVDRVLRDRRAQVDDLCEAVARGERPDDSTMLPTRFTFDGADGSDPWWDFQTDGYGTWLWSVVTYANRHGLSLERWRRGIDVAVDYLIAFWDQPCYDWWEEHVEQRHVSTLGAIHGGLAAIAPYTSVPVLEVSERIRSLVDAQGKQAGHLTKWLGSSAVDGSLPACVVPFGLVSGETAIATLAAVARDLDVDGGVHRFTADVFYGGGQWILLSALLGWNLAVAGDTARAWRHLRWIAEQATADGDLPEQVPHHLLHPGSRDEWIARWGTVATPLLWSHGMYLILADELGVLSEKA